MISEAATRTLFEALSEGIVLFNKEGDIQYLNAIAASMIGLPQKTLLSVDWRGFTETSVLIQRCLHLVAASLRQKIVLTDSIFCGTKKKLYVDLIAVPNRDNEGNSEGCSLILQDNSNHYRVLEMGKNFVANASHELRTPITIIRGFTETLQDLPELSSEMLHDITDKILRNCQRMDYLVKSLLTLSDIENLPLTQRENYDIVRLIEECREYLLSAKKQVYVDIDIRSKTPLLVPIVPDLLSLAILNILENAVKYSDPPARITVALEVREENVMIHIMDKGKGIPQSDLEHIFDRFYTVHKAHSRKLGGAGLGLSIVKIIIEKHDGIICVTSSLNEGSCFTISLPLLDIVRN